MGKGDTVPDRFVGKVMAMGWFNDLKRRVKDWMQIAGANTGVAREFRDVFELGGVPSFNEFYNFGIFIWKALYRGFYAPWHLIPAPTIANRDAKRQVFRLNIAKAVVAEMAGLVWGEECAVNVSMDGRESTDEDPDPLGEFVH